MAALCSPPERAVDCRTCRPDLAALANSLLYRVQELSEDLADAFGSSIDFYGAGSAVTPQQLTESLRSSLTFILPS